jgi:hypothetical protein
MLTVKFLKYQVSKPSGGPCCMEHVVVHSAKIVCVELTDVHGRSVVTLEKDSGQESFTIGDVARTDVMFNVAYVMNDAGKTVETIR